MFSPSPNLDFSCVFFLFYIRFYSFLFTNKETMKSVSCSYFFLCVWNWMVSHNDDYKVVGCWYNNHEFSMESSETSFLFIKEKCFVCLGHTFTDNFCSFGLHILSILTDLKGRSYRCRFLITFSFKTSRTIGRKQTFLKWD